MTNKTKLTLILISLLAAGQTWAACSVAGDLKTNPCEGAPDMLAPPGERDGSAYKGTPFFLECQGMANATWEQLNPASGANWEGKWKYTYNEAYTEHLKSAETALEEALSAQETPQQSNQTEGANTEAAPSQQTGDSKQSKVVEAAKKIATAYSETFQSLAKAREAILKCHGMLGLTQRLGQGDYQEAKTWNPSTTKTSLDGQIKCKAMGAETQDYLPCTTAISAYDGLFVADQGVQVYQQVSYADKSMDIQQTLAENSTSVTAGLEAQKSNLEAQADLANQKAVFDGAKAAALAAAAGNMPSLSDLVGECKASLSRGGLNQINATFNTISDHLNARLSAYQQAASAYVNIVPENTPLTVKTIKDSVGNGEATHTPNSGLPNINAAVIVKIFKVGEGQARSQGDGKSAENICNNVAGTEAQALIMNDEAHQKMKAAMIAAGIDAAGNLAKAAILNKHADRIEDAIGDVESFAPPEFTGPAFEDGMFTECSADPTSEACALEEANRSVDFAGNNISITGFERGVVGGTKNDGIAAMNDLDTSSSAARGGTSAPTIGSAIEAVDKSSGLEDTVSKAGITNNPGGNGGGGGGGGGGGPSGIAPPSGGGAQPLGSENQAANGIAGNTSKISFDGGTGRSTSLSGGTRAAAARKETKVDNPFDKLFGKKGAGNELSFRNPAAIGKGKGSVLEQISRRYTEVSKTNRLHKYEEK